MEAIQIDSMWKLNSKQFNASPSILVAVDKTSRPPVAKVWKNTNHHTTILFLQEYLNVQGVPKLSELDKGSAYISEEYNVSAVIIIRNYGTPNLHTGTGLVERTIQSIDNW